MTEEQMGAPVAAPPSLVQQVTARLTAAIQAGTWEQAADLVMEQAQAADPEALDSLAWLEAAMRSRMVALRMLAEG